jgi:hypothetical protein
MRRNVVYNVHFTVQSAPQESLDPDHTGTPAFFGLRPSRETILGDRGIAPQHAF